MGVRSTEQSAGIVSLRAVVPTSKKYPAEEILKISFAGCFLFAQDIRTSSHMRETALHFQGEYDTI